MKEPANIGKTTTIVNQGSMRERGLVKGCGGL
jgi:hypothetical protein